MNDSNLYEPRTERSHAASSAGRRRRLSNDKRFLISANVDKRRGVSL